MAAQQLAHRAASRPMRAFSVSLRSAAGPICYTALARSTSEALGDALGDALARPDLLPPVAGSVKPVGSPADALRGYFLKLALADLVEG